MKFIKLIPLAIELAKTVEAQVPLPGKGKEKLSFALEAAGAAYDVEEELRTSWGNRDAFIGATAKALGFSVALYNAIGLFKKQK